MSRLTILVLICSWFFPIKPETGFDYCTIHCINGTQTVQHLACLRQNQCSFPASGCFNFQNASLTPTERKLILDEHNHLRNIVALGETGIFANNVTASNMNELKWNDELEYIALCVVNTCSQYSKGVQMCLDTRNGKSGKNIAYKRVSVATHELGSPNKLKEYIYGWYSEIEGLSKRKVDAFPLEDSFNIEHVSQIIWAKTTTIGCARSIFGQYTTIFACIYSPAGNINEQPIFVRGLPCSGCEYGLCSETYRGLCKVFENRTNFQDITNTPTIFPQKIMQATTKATEMATSWIKYHDRRLREINKYVEGTDLSNEETVAMDDNDSSTQLSVKSNVANDDQVIEKPRSSSGWIQGRTILEDFTDFVVVMFVGLRLSCTTL